MATTQEAKKPVKRGPVYFRALDWDRGEDELFATTIDRHLASMREGDETQRRLLLAKPEKGTGQFYCSELYFAGESKDNCGKQCDAYAPLNGKNGRCKHHRPLYEPVGDTLLLTLDGGLTPAPPQVCRVCGCTEDNCSGCVERTGRACWWVEEDLCSACVKQEGNINWN
ncbi:MAG TPA: hypothetical protein PLB89_05045 [Flavobacteriales bacterium]|nr:hypothetical protein [Flavobacteriales bacterium]